MLLEFTLTIATLRTQSQLGGARNVFDDFMTDDISVRKQNGDLLEGLKASVQRDKIF